MDIARAIQIGLFVREAERADTSDKLPFDSPPGYEIVMPFYGNDLATDVKRDRGIVPTDYLPFGFIARSVGAGTDFVVAIRGTASIWEWAQDAQFRKVQFPYAVGAGDTEDGFTDVYSSLRAEPNNAGPRLADTLRDLLAGNVGYTLTISGHSLGGSLATLAALDVVASGVHNNPDVYTFASPYVGDGLFANTYDRLVTRTWRIANQMDIVTHLPPSLLGYTHVQQPVVVNSAGKVNPTVPCLHHLTTYLHLLSPNPADIPLDPECQPT